MPKSDTCCKHPVLEIQILGSRIGPQPAAADRGGRAGERSRKGLRSPAKKRSGSGLVEA